MDDQARREGGRAAAAARALALAALADRLLVELEERRWLADVAAALARSRAWRAGRWRWN